MGLADCTADGFKALSAHLRADTTILNLKHQVAESGISKVEVPHVLESTLVDLSEGSLAGNRTAEGVATSSSGRHLFDNLESILQKILLSLILLNSGFHLTLDSLPNIIERCLGGSKLASVMVKGRVDTELVVGAAISEVQTGGDREHSDILASTPDSIDWNIELDLAADKEGQLGKRELIRRESALDWAGAALLNGLLDRLGDQGRILRNMLERFLGDSFQGSVVVETKITGMDDMVSSGLFRKVVK
ncbi:hypothetical protein HG530_009775 [Fusarium avenaceum]|nr:hypothetical protein HG530_009775 [Fusarium avenaceum]